LCITYASCFWNNKNYNGIYKEYRIINFTKQLSWYLLLFHGEIHALPHDLVLKVHMLMKSIAFKPLYLQKNV